MTVVLALLAGTAAIGLGMAWRHLRGRPVPLTAAIAHGIFAVAGFAMFTVALLAGGGITSQMVGAYAVMLIGGVLGVVLISWHTFGRGRHPTVVLAAHGALGLLVVGLLVAALR